MANDLERFITVSRLIRRPEGVTTEEIATELGVSVRTAYRIIAAMEENYFPITQSQDGHSKRWHILEGARDNLGLVHTDTRLDAEDQALLKMILGLLGRNAILREWTDSLARKLKCLGAFGGGYWASGMNNVMISAGNVPKLQQPKDAEHLRILLSAIEKKTTVRMTYQPPFAKQRSEYHVFPLCCFFTVEGAYVYDVTERRHLTMHAVERMRSLSADPKPLFTPENTYDVQELLSDPFGILLESNWVDTDVVLDQQDGWYQAQKAWPGRYVTWKQESDGTYRFSIHTRGPYGLNRWLLDRLSHILAISNPAVQALLEQTIAAQEKLFAM